MEKRDLNLSLFSTSYITNNESLSSGAKLKSFAFFILGTDKPLMGSILGIYERRVADISDMQFAELLGKLSSSDLETYDRWTDSRIGLAQRNASQFRQIPPDKFPPFDSASNTVVIADMRLDSREDLGAVLGYTESELLTASDIDLLSSAWNKWGKDCPKYLIGDFAFAIWDISKNSLFCARDHIGARPFYYSLSRERFVFGSGINTILAAPGVSDRLDEDYVISSLIDNRFYNKTYTYLRDIRKLPSGHCLTVTGNDFKLERYWLPENMQRQRFSSDDEYAEAALEIYRKAVSDRLPKVDRVGVHLSGGLDSSSIAVLAARECRRLGTEAPAVYCWQPPPDNNSERDDEYELIGAICDQERLDPQYCPAKAKHIFEILCKDPVLEAIDGTRLIETSVQKKASSQGVRTILSGFGGDESLSHSGRGAYNTNLLLRGRWLELYRVLEPHGSPLKLMAMEALLLPFADRSKARGKIAARSFRELPEKLTFVRKGLKPKKNLGYTQRRLLSIRSTLLWTWQTGMLTERLESWAASGIENQITYAYPLLDRRLMEFVIGLPPKQFVKGRWKRWIMRNAMDGILPEKVRWYESKLDPNRLSQMKSENCVALEMVARRLTERKEPPSRSKYFDIAKLTKYLESEGLAKQKKQGVIMNALQFLDF